MADIPRPWSLWRLLWPTGLLAFSLGLLYFPGIWESADLEPSVQFHMTQVCVIGAALCWLAILVWFLFLSGLSRRIRLTGLALVALLGIGWAACIEEVLPTGQMVLNFRYRWQPRPADRLASYLADEGKPAQQEFAPIRLTIDPVNDFPRYRGSRADGVVRPAELLDVRWESKQPREVWRHPCGGGFSGFAVAGNVALTLEQRGEEEVLVCYDRATGKSRWTHAWPARFKEPTGNGCRSTPTIAPDGKVYALGALGDLVCVEGTTGKLQWATNILTDAGARCVTWGMTGSPLVVDDLVIVNPGIDPANNAEKAVAAYERQTGKLQWAKGRHGAGYSSPMLANLAGRSQVLLFDAGGLAGLEIRTGEELWRHSWETFQDMNIIQPVVVEPDRVFLSSETTNGGAMLRLRQKAGKFNVEVEWANHNLCAQYANPVKVGNTIYGLSNGRLVCVDVETGKRYWRASRSSGRGQLLFVGGSLLVQEENGHLMLVAPNQRQFEQLGRMQVLSEGRNWNTFAAAGRFLFLRNEVEMVCLELPQRE